MTASGNEINGDEDDGRFLSQTLVGDGSITARVNSIVLTNYAATAGVMIRPIKTSPTGNAESRMVDVRIPRLGNLGMAWRATDFTASSFAGGVSNAHPVYWLRLTRAGNVFTGYYSTDGATWTQIDTPKTVVMPQSVRIGLWASARSTTANTTAVFDNVTVTGTKGL